MPPKILKINGARNHRLETFSFCCGGAVALVAIDGEDDADGVVNCSLACNGVAQYGQNLSFSPTGLPHEGQNISFSLELRLSQAFV